MARPIPIANPQRGAIQASHLLRLSPDDLAESFADARPATDELSDPELMLDADAPDPGDTRQEPPRGPTASASNGVQADTKSTETEAARLRAENAHLRESLAQLEALLQQQADGQRPAAADWAEREKEYERLLEEKSEVIRELHSKIQELQERPAGATLPREEELLALSEELERERAQLKEDEEALMQQMRDMEVQMARERAEMARQRTELERLHKEIHHELETAARDIVLRQRLAPLQRRQQELANHRGAKAPSEADSNCDDALASASTVPSAKQGGFLRRLFG